MSCCLQPILSKSCSAHQQLFDMIYIHIYIYIYGVVERGMTFPVLQNGEQKLRRIICFVYLGKAKASQVVGGKWMGESPKVLTIVQSASMPTAWLHPAGPGDMCVHGWVGQWAMITRCMRPMIMLSGAQTDSTQTNFWRGRF